MQALFLGSLLRGIGKRGDQAQREGDRFSWTRQKEYTWEVPALHPDLALPVYERQARDGHLRGAVGPDGPQPWSDAPGGQPCQAAHLARTPTAQ